MSNGRRMSKVAAVAITMIADRLYGITMKPQELSVYGDSLTVSLSYAPMYEDPTAVADTHFKLLVLEASVEVPEDDNLGDISGSELEVLKIGWELEVTADPACSVADLVESDEEMPRLLDRVADTVNELARRAGLEAPFGPDIIAGLLQRYREQGLAED